MRNHRRIPWMFALVIGVGGGLLGCSDLLVETDGGAGTFSLQVGQELEITLHTVGGGEYRSPPQVSSGALRFLDVRVVGPYVPSGPHQRFRFAAMRSGRAIVRFHHSQQGPTVEDTVNIH